MIGLSTPTYDINGALIIDELPNSITREVIRRSRRSSTLDGGAVLVDQGFSAGDQTFRVRWKIKSEQEYLKARRLVELYSLITVATRDGAFSANPAKLALSSRVAELELLLIDEVS